MTDLQTLFAEWEKRQADRFGRLEQQGLILFRAVQILARENAAMSKLTDDLSAIADDTLDAAKTLIGFKDEDTSALGNLTTKFGAVRDTLRQAIADHQAQQQAPQGNDAAVAAPTTAGTTSIPVTASLASTLSAQLGNAITSGAKVGLSGPGIAVGTTVEGVDTAVPGGQPVVTISQPTTAAHTGDGTETLSATTMPASAPSGPGAAVPQPIASATGDTAGTTLLGNAAPVAGTPAAGGKTILADGTEA